MAHDLCSTAKQCEANAQRFLRWVKHVACGTNWMKNIPIPFPPHTHPHPHAHPHLPRPFSLIAQQAALEQRLRLSAGSAAAGRAWISLRPETSPGQGSGVKGWGRG